MGQIFNDAKAKAEEFEKKIPSQLAAMRRKEGLLAADLWRQVADLRISTCTVESALVESKAHVENHGAQLLRVQTQARVTMNGLMEQIQSTERQTESDRDRTQKDLSDIRTKFNIDIRKQLEQEQNVDEQLRRIRAQNNRLSMELGKHMREGDSERFHEQLEVLQKQVRIWK